MSTEQIAREVLARLEQAWNSGDGNAFGAPYRDDASFVTIRGELAHGAEIGTGHAQILTSIYAGSTNHMELLEAQRVSDDVIIATSRNTLDAPARTACRRARGDVDLGAGPLRRRLADRHLPEHPGRCAMTAETTAGLAPAVAVPGAVGRRWPAVLLGLGGLLTAVGGSLHPHDAQETLTDTLVGLLSSPAWGTSHLLILAGVLLVVAGLAGARRERLFPDQVRGWLTVAIVCWAIAVVELVPHLLAGSEHHALEAGEATPMLTTHLTLSVVTEPLLGLSIAALAVAVARAAHTVPASLLAVVGVVGGVVFGAAAPLVAVTQDPAFTALFSADALISVWLVGTALRLLLAHRARRTA